MPAYEHLNSFQSGRYIRVHRGFAGVHHDEVDTSNLGVHWVADDHAGQADIFATSQIGLGDGEETYSENVRGTVLTGLVHKRHIMDRNSAEHEEWSNYGEGAVESENETPLRPGTPVHIIGATDFNVDANDDSDREFTPRIRGRA